MSLTARFLLGFALVASVGLFVLFTQLIRRVERQYMEAVEEPMVDVVNILAEILAQTVDGGALQPEAVESAVRAAQARELKAQIYNRTKTKVDMEVYVTDAQGRVLFDSAGIEPPGAVSTRRDVNLTLLGEYGARSSRSNSYDPLSIVMYVGAPIEHEGKLIGMVSVAKPQRGVLAFIWETERWLKWSIITTVLLMLGGIYMAARWATRPLEALARHALAVSRGERSTSPHMPGHQMKTLAKALEDMRDALEGREYVESYVQSLTHELKSPVAAILGASEILQGGDVPPAKQARFLGNIRSEAGRLQDLLERLLHLAALEKQKTLLKCEPVELRELILRVWDHHALLAQAYRLAERNVIELEDEGPGVPDYAHDRVFERFYSLPRPDTGKKSTGLGLCFVKEAATLHGGSIELLSRDQGPGTKAVLVLP